MEIVNAGNRIGYNYPRRIKMFMPFASAGA